MSKVHKRVESPAEYKEMVQAADVLGLEVTEALMYGQWKTDDGYPVSPGQVEIEKVGRKYFYIEVTARKEKVHPVNGDRVRDNGYVSVTLR